MQINYLLVIIRLCISKTEKLKPWYTYDYSEQQLWICFLIVLIVQV